MKTERTQFCGESFVFLLPLRHNVSLKHLYESSIYAGSD